MSSNTQNIIGTSGDRGRILGPGEAVTGNPVVIRIGHAALEAAVAYPLGTPGGAGSRDSMDVAAQMPTGKIPKPKNAPSIVAKNTEQSRCFSQ